MLPHQERVVKELQELNIKLEALRNFIAESEVFMSLGYSEKLLLRMQCTHMTGYADILTERIRRFK